MTLLFFDYGTSNCKVYFFISLSLSLSSCRTKKPPTAQPAAKIASATPLHIPQSFDNARTIEELNQAQISYLMKQPSFTIEDDNEPNLFRDLEIMEPVEFQNKTFQQHLDNLPWEDDLLTGTIERRLIAGKHMTFCRLHNDTLALVRAYYLLFSKNDLHQGCIRATDGPRFLLMFKGAFSLFTSPLLPTKIHTFLHTST